MSEAPWQSRTINTNEPIDWDAAIENMMVSVGITCSVCRKEQVAHTTYKEVVIGHPKGIQYRTYERGPSYCEGCYKEKK